LIAQKLIHLVLIVRKEAKEILACHEGSSILSFLTYLRNIDKVFHEDSREKPSAK